MITEEKIIVLLDCFELKEANAALKTFERVGGDAERIVLAPITEKLGTMNTAEAISSVANGKWDGGQARKGSKRSALIAGADKKNAVALVRCFKSVLPKESDSAFAMVTETGMKWSIDYYLAHIRNEHDYMKTADPSSDPDMREIPEAY